MNVPVVLPDAIVTLTGVFAAPVFELERVITRPVEGAGPLMVTVPVTFVELLPTTVLGVTLTETSVGA